MPQLASPIQHVSPPNYSAFRYRAVIVHPTHNSCLPGMPSRHKSPHLRRKTRHTDTIEERLAARCIDTPAVVRGVEHKSKRVRGHPSKHSPPRRGRSFLSPWCSNSRQTSPTSWLWTETAPCALQHVPLCPGAEAVAATRRPIGSRWSSDDARSRNAPSPEARDTRGRVPPGSGKETENTNVSQARLRYRQRSGKPAQSPPPSCYPRHDQELFSRFHPFTKQRLFHPAIGTPNCYRNTSSERPFPTNSARSRRGPQCTSTVQGSGLTTTAMGGGNFMARPNFGEFDSPGHQDA